MTDGTALPTLLRGFFEEYLAAQRDVSANTIHAYRDSLKLLLRFAARRTGRQVVRLRLADLGADTVLAFLAHLETERKNCVATRNCRLVAVHRFFAYIGDRDPRHAELCHRVLDIPVKKTVSSAMTYLDRDEMKALLAIPTPAQRLGLRDHALLTFLYNTGARASEAVAASIRDIRFETPSQARLLGKECHPYCISFRCRDKTTGTRAGRPACALASSSADGLRVVHRGTAVGRYTDAHGASRIAPRSAPSAA